MRIVVKNGKTTVTLFAQERKTLAAAIDVCNALREHARNGVTGEAAEKASVQLLLLTSSLPDEKQKELFPPAPTEKATK